MTSGVDRLRNRRKTRPKVEPRHPTGGGAAKTLDDLNNAGPSLPPDAQNPGPEEIAEAAAPNHRRRKMRGRSPRPIRPQVSSLRGT